jgi:hypothetical protein
VKAQATLHPVTSPAPYLCIPVLLAACLTLLPLQASAKRLIIPAGREATIQDFLEPTDGALVPGADFTTESISINDDHIVVRYIDKSSNHQPVAIVLLPPDGDCPRSRRISNIFCVDSDATKAAEPIIRSLQHRGTALSFSEIWEPEAGEITSPTRNNAGTATGIGDFGPDLSRQIRSAVTSLWLLLLLLTAGALLGPLKSSFIPGKRRQTLVLYTGLFVGALVLRMALATFGPGDLKMVDEAALLMEYNVVPFHGPATHALLAVLFEIAGPSDRIIVWMMLLCGALAVPVGAAVARRLWNSPAAAMGTGVAIMLHPVFVRMSGEASRQAHVLLLAAMACLATLRAEDDRSWVNAGLAVVCTTLCVLTRPEALVLVPLLISLTIFLAVEQRRLPPLQVLVQHGLVLLTVIPYKMLIATDTAEMVNLAELFDRILPHFWAAESNAFMNLNFTPVAFLVLAVIALFAGVSRNRLTGLWAGLALFGIAIPLSTMTIGKGDEVQLASVRYHTLSLFVFCLLVGLGVPLLHQALVRFVRRPRVRNTVIAILLCLSALSLWYPYRQVTGTTTIDAEYEATREWLPQLPENAQIFTAYTQQIPFDFSLKPPVHLSVVLDRMDTDWWIFPDDWGRQPAGPVYLLTQSGCHYTLLENYEFMDQDEVKNFQFRTTCQRIHDWTQTRTPDYSRTILDRPFLSAGILRAPFTVGLYRITEDDWKILARKGD